MDLVSYTHWHLAGCCKSSGLIDGILELESTGVDYMYCHLRE